MFSLYITLLCPITRVHVQLVYTYSTIEKLGGTGHRVKHAVQQAIKLKNYAEFFKMFEDENKNHK